MRTEKAIVLGPYVEKHGEKERFRLILKSSGRRKSLFYPTLAEARRAKARLEKEASRLDEKPVEELITEYIRYVGEYEGYRERTRANEQQRLRHFFGSTASEMRLSTITERKAEEMYLSHTRRFGHQTARPLSPTTHRGDLRILKRFGGWAQKAGYVVRNPFAHVAPLGRDQAGKPQLRMDELDRWLQVAWADVQEGKDTALAAMLCLWRGLRVSEVLGRVVRDLDEDGSVLVIERAKTRAGNRRVDVPAFLQPYLRRLGDGQAADAWLFRQEREPKKHRHQQALYKRVRSICRRANVPPICPHSLRGMNATLKLQAGASEDYVARSIGHTSFGVTLRHYVDAGVKARVDDQRVDTALARVSSAVRGQPALQPSSMQALLLSLSDKERAALLQALLEQHPAP
jgi:integrase